MLPHGLGAYSFSGLLCEPCGLYEGITFSFFVLCFFPFLLLRLSFKKTSALVAVIPVIFYTFIAGLGVAAVRSTIMVLSFLLALQPDREKDLYDA